MNLATQSWLVRVCMILPPSPPLPSPLQHDVEAEGRKLTKEICDAYTGADKPPACHSSYWLH